MKKNEKEEEGAKIKVSLVLPLRYFKNCLFVVVLLKSQLSYQVRSFVGPSETEHFSKQIR